jgi:PKD repeat protein
MKKIMFLGVVGALALTSCNKEPEVSFDASKSSVIVGEEITFTNSSEAKKVYNIAWNFGDGGSSNTFDAAHQYSRPGTYTVTLSATSKKGNKSASVSKKITVTAAPRTDVDMSGMPDDVRQAWEQLIAGEGKWKLTSGNMAQTNNCGYSNQPASIVSPGTKYVVQFLKDGSATITDENGNITQFGWQFIGGGMADIYFTAPVDMGSFTTTQTFDNVHSFTISGSSLTLKRTKIEDNTNTNGDDCKVTTVTTITFTKQ